MPSRLLLLLVIWGAVANDCFGGMPSLQLTDVGKMRLSTISFFVFVILLSAVGIRWIWNGLRKDFPSLPKLSYRGSLAIVVLWGMVFVVVLTMISGARELMTPGAWEKNGLTYRLSEPVADDESDSGTNRSEISVSNNDRIAGLRVLWRSLKAFADAHGGQFPSTAEFLELDSTLLELPGQPGVHYIYRPPVSGETDTAEPLALEPQVYDGPQFALYPDAIVTVFSAEGRTR